ncbi:MAG TPA: guanylate kinase [Anaerolineaceae bacterium]|nr:guanylate kinase [Anaerolineaceae bacterium]
MSPDDVSFDLLHPRPLLIVISGTSGVGKDSVIRGLKRRRLPLHVVITATTRAPREEEQNGRDYFFLTREEFEDRIEEGWFAEHAVVYSDLKGIPRHQIEEALASGKDVVARVDVQGAKTLRGLYPQAVLIFIVPGSFDEWYQRLTRRGTESEADLKVRVSTAREEVKQIGLFDYVVVNSEDQIERAVDDVVSIINTEHMAVQHRRIL